MPYIPLTRRCYFVLWNQIQLSQRISTFKDAPEEEQPSKKAENEYVSLVLKNGPKDGNKHGPSDQGQKEKKAPLVESEDTDDELGKIYTFKFRSLWNIGNGF